MANGAVLITGTSTGIGCAAARDLAARGFHVYAGVRDERAAARLRAANGNITPVLLDVRDPNQIDAALHLIAENHGGCMWGLVNNAAVVDMCPIELQAEDRLGVIVETNLMAPIRLIQRSLPMLRRAEGRIVNIGSLESRLSLPSAAMYSASKAALRSLSDSLRLELRPWNIPVVVVEPGIVKTEMPNKGARTLAESARRVPEDLAPYRAILDEEWMRRFMPLGSTVRASVRMIATALTTPHPRGHYYVGADAKVVGALRWLLPNRWTEGAIARAMRIPRPGR